jgi:acetylornithine/N-succinyldiaminopimelate aminotransferase
MSHLLWYPGHDLSLPNIVRAENCHLYDSDGKVYVDLESGVWSTAIGHAHPRIVRALSDQAARIAHTGFCYSSTAVEEAAQEILSLLEFDQGKCVFLCSGSEAVEYSIRATRQIEQRPLLMTMTDSYCGSYEVV